MQTLDQDQLPPGASAEKAQTMAEYAVVLGVITLAIVSAFGVLSGGIQGVLQATTNLL